MGKLNIHRPIYRITSRIDLIEPTSILEVQYLQIYLHNDDNEAV